MSSFLIVLVSNCPRHFVLFPSISYYSYYFLLFLLLCMPRLASAFGGSRKEKGDIKVSVYKCVAMSVYRRMAKHQCNASHQSMDSRLHDCRISLTPQLHTLSGSIVNRPENQCLGRFAVRAVALSMSGNFRYFEGVSTIEERKL